MVQGTLILIATHIDTVHSIILIGTALITTHIVMAQDITAIMILSITTHFITMVITLMDTADIIQDSMLALAGDLDLVMVVVITIPSGAQAHMLPTVMDITHITTDVISRQSM